MSLPQFTGWRPLELDETIQKGDRNVLTANQEYYLHRNLSEGNKWLSPYHKVDPASFKWGSLQRNHTCMSGVSGWRYYRKLEEGEAQPPPSTKGRAYLKFGLHPIQSKPLPLP